MEENDAEELTKEELEKRLAEAEAKVEELEKPSEEPEETLVGDTD